MNSPAGFGERDFNERDFDQLDFDQVDFDQIDKAIDQMMSGPEAARPKMRAELEGLLDIASDLRDLPRPDFKMRLKAELEWQSWSPAAGERLETPPAGRPFMHGASLSITTVPEVDITPSFSGSGYGLYPISRANFAASVALHAVAIAVFVGLGMWMAQNHPNDLTSTQAKVTLLAVYRPDPPMTPAANKSASGGGGGGGERSKLQLSAGGPPKTSMRAQLAPPVVIHPQEKSKIMAEPTVVADLKLSASPQVGDPLSKLMAPSSGTGVRGGVGSGSGGGYGTGPGLGVGRGDRYGYGGGASGNGTITTPKLIYSPDPEFSEEARKVKHQGVVVLTVLVGVDGRIHNAQITRSLGMGLDEKALETVKLWKFEPARAGDGSPVAVYASIEVSFRLY